MIAHVAVKRRGGARVLGSNPVGLMLYLFGPGKANEHSRQRVIAASTALGIIDGTRPDYRTQREEIKELGGQFDSHRKAFGKEFPNGHLWHCVISLPPGDSTTERRLTDAQWAEVVREAVGRLGFEAEGKAPVPVDRCPSRPVCGRQRARPPGREPAAGGRHDRVALPGLGHAQQAVP